MAYARSSDTLHARVPALPPPAGRYMARQGHGTGRAACGVLAFWHRVWVRDSYDDAAANACAPYGAIRSASPRHPAGWMAGAGRARSSRQDALLLLWRAVRDP